MTGRVAVVAMPHAELAAWRASRADGGAPLPEPVDGDGYEALTVVVDDVEVGGAVLTYAQESDRRRALVRVLQTTVPGDATDLWAGVLGALETHVRGRGAVTLVTSVPPTLAASFQAAGFAATMTSMAKRLDPTSPTELQEDRRVAVRPMDAAERRTFVAEAAVFLRAGMERSGVLVGTAVPLGEIDTRLARLLDDPPPSDELLVTGLVDGEPVGRVWATLRTTDDGALDFLGNTIDLDPRFRGRGLTRSFLGAMRRHLLEIGVRDMHLRLYGYDHRARRTFLAEGAGVTDVHLRKDLA